MKFGDLPGVILVKKGEKGQILLRNTYRGEDGYTHERMEYQLAMYLKRKQEG